jgi:hypothetical protein
LQSIQVILARQTLTGAGPFLIAWNISICGRRFFFDDHSLFFGTCEGRIQERRFPEKACRLDAPIALPASAPSTTLEMKNIPNRDQTVNISPF